MTNSQIQEMLDIALERAEKLCRTSQYEAATTFCKQVLKIDNTNATAWFLLGIANRFTNKISEAIIALDKAATLADNEQNREHALAMRKTIDEPV